MTSHPRQIGVGAGGGILGSGITGLLISNPDGWAIVGALSFGYLANKSFTLAYESNFAGIQEGLDYLGGFVQDGLETVGEASLNNVLTVTTIGGVIYSSFKEYQDSVREGIKERGQNLKRNIKNAGEAIESGIEAINLLN